MTNKIREQIIKLVNYNWLDELNDFRDHPDDKNHIFITMVALDDYVRGANTSAESYVKREVADG